MKITTVAADTRETLFEEEYLARKPANGLVERSINLENGFINGLLREINVKDISIQYGEFRVLKDTSVNISFSSPVLTLYFNLKNPINGKVLENSESFNVNGNEFCLLFYDAGSQTIHIEKQQDIQYLRVDLLPGFLMRTIDGHLANPEFVFKDFGLSPPGRRKVTGLITPEMRKKIEQILHSKCRGLAKIVYVKSKVLELLALQLHEIELLRENTEKHFIGREDVEKLYKAREILKERLADPPTLKDLSKLCSINEFKLKKGFREVFNNTVYGISFEFRMTAARQLLQEGNLSIMNVAEQVGYQYSHHFSKAFKQKYNLLPREIRKSNKLRDS